MTEHMTPQHVEQQAEQADAMTQQRTSQQQVDGDGDMVMVQETQKQVQHVEHQTEQAASMTPQHVEQQAEQAHAMTQQRASQQRAEGDEDMVKVQEHNSKCSMWSNSQGREMRCQKSMLSNDQSRQMR